MDQERTLLHRPEPIPHESLAGYLVRLAKANSYPSTQWIMQLAGLYQSTPVLPSVKVLEALHVLTGQPKTALRDLTLHRYAALLNPYDRTSEQLEHVATQRYVHHKARGIRFCTVCASLGRPWKLEWQLRMVTACLEHSVLLRETCPVCSRPFGIRTWWEAKCHCGLCLEDMNTAPVNVGASGYSAQAIMQTALTSPQGDSALWFSGLDLYQRWFAAFPAGMLSLDDFSNQSPGVHKAKLWEPIERDHIHYGLAVQALGGGEEGFIRWCEFKKSLGAVGGKFSFGYLRHFRKLTELLRNYPELPHLNTWFQSYLSSYWMESYVHVGHRSDGHRPQYVGLEKAAKLIRCRAWAVAYLLDAGLLRGYLKPMDLTGRLGGLVEQDSISELLSRQGEAVDLGEAAMRLGLSPEQVKDMYYRGKIAAERGPITDGTQDLWFHPSYLETLQSDPSVDYRPSTAVCSSLPLDRVELTLGIHPNLLPLLQTHGLLVISHEGIREWSTFKDRFLWEFQAARYLGLPLPTFRRWVSWGRLRPVLKIGRTALYERRKLDAWTPMVRCTTKEAALLLGLSHPQQFTRSYLDTGRVKPIGGPGVDPGPTLLFDRREILMLVSDPDSIRAPTAPIDPTPSPYTNELLSTTEAATLLGLSVGAFERRYRATNRLIPIRQWVGTLKNYYRREDVERLVR